MGIVLMSTLGLYFVAARMNALPSDSNDYDNSGNTLPVEQPASRRIRGINDLPQDQPRGGS